MIDERINLLRNKMIERNIDYYIAIDSDYHNSEHVDPHFKERSFLTGFTGSAGVIIVSKDEACLFTDGRYHIQAEEQIKGSSIKLYKVGLEGVINHLDYLKQNVKDGDTVGFDGRCFSLNDFERINEQFKGKDVKTKIDFDLVGEVWHDRPDVFKGSAFSLDLKYCGKTREEKLKDVRCKMEELNASHYVISSLDDIAWLLNIRGNDIPHNPIVVSFLLIDRDDVFFFVDGDKISDEISLELKKAGVKLKKYGDIYDFIESIKEGSILFDKSKTNCKLVNSIDKNVKKIMLRNITTDMKSIKNEVEIKNIREAEIKDCVAFVKFFSYLEDHIEKDTITELDVSDLLLKFRKEQEGFIELSYETIAGYMENAASAHYQATSEKYSVLKPEGFLLIDSGGQYYGGTIDITRTISLGKISDEMKRDFTYALKALINLSRTKFLKGTNGISFDMMARSVLWNYGLDYKHGTGHGLGFMLNVHEGPQSFSLRADPKVYIEPGMVTTNEPGIYKEGKYGIRHESDLLAVLIGKNEYGDTFMEFETLTYCPFDLKSIDKKYLNSDEINWLNEYHKKTYELLSPLLEGRDLDWLKRATVPLYV
ncbi:MAG: aminopeptidase P family protein [Oscillospiraceae bacterium]|nr:aminopeptidase P family protein [Oscillospiraceae bacterium]